ncbi:MAG: GerW family sporulation protein [Christensenellales bacterium]|jgi:sporulation protein YtfJ
MSINSLNEMLAGTIDKLKGLVDVDSIVGKPIITADNTTIVPITKVCFGFLTGGGEIGANKERISELADPFAGIGGGVSLVPIGFLVVSDGGATIVKPEGDNVDKWLDILQSGIRSMLKK